MVRSLLLIGLCGACGTDVFAAGDGSSDAAGGPDGLACGSFCTTQSAGVAFCADFDETQLIAGWDGVDSNDATGTLSMDSTSCPDSLLVDVPQQAVASAATSVRYLLTKTLASSAVDVTVTFDVKLPAFTPPPKGDGGVLPFEDDFLVLFLHKTASISAGDYNVRIHHSGDGAWFLRVANPTNVAAANAPIATPLLGAWNHMSLKVHFVTDATGSATLTYMTSPSASAMTTTTPGVPTTDSQSSPLTLSVGAYTSAASTQDWKFQFDSIVLR